MLAGYVSVEDGTGLVHTAPGHGAEDYQTGRAYQLPTLSPVDASGRFTDEAPEWLTRQAGLRGQPGDRRPAEGIGPPVPRAAVRAQLPALLAVQEAGDLPGDRAVVHRRRSQRPARPDAQGDRRGPLAARTGARRGSRRWSRSAPTGASAASGPGACRSRRSAATTCGTQLLTAETVRHFRDLFRARRGRRLVHPAGRGAAAARRGLPAVRRHVVPQGGRHPRRLVRVGLEPPRRARRAELRPGRLAGVHVPGRLRPAPRLVPVVDPDRRRHARARAPFETVLTHGFVVDDKGEKMSKSVGNDDLGRQGDRAVRRRRPAALRRQHGLRRRRPDERARHQGDVRGVPQDPQHVPLPAGQPRGLRAVRPGGGRPVDACTRSTAGPSASSTG